MSSLISMISTLYALINHARGPYEEIFVMTFMAYGPNTAREFRFPGNILEINTYEDKFLSSHRNID